MSIGFDQETDAWGRLETVEEPQHLKYQLRSTCSADSLVIFHPDHSSEQIALDLPSAHAVIDLADAR